MDASFLTFLYENKKERSPLLKILFQFLLLILTSAFPLLLLLAFPASPFAFTSPLTMTNPGLILSASPVEGVQLITLNRPEKRNALSKGMIKEFLGALSLADVDESVRVIVIAGQGRCFSGKSIKTRHVQDY